MGEGRDPGFDPNAANLMDYKVDDGTMAKDCRNHQRPPTQEWQAGKISHPGPLRPPNMPKAAKFYILAPLGAWSLATVG